MISTDLNFVGLLTCVEEEPLVCAPLSLCVVSCRVTEPPRKIQIKSCLILVRLRIFALIVEGGIINSPFPFLT